MELSFDLPDGKVTAETAAKDVRGDAYYQHIFDLAAPAGIATPQPHPGVSPYINTPATTNNDYFYQPPPTI